jgi:hypothetical protein
LEIAFEEGGADHGWPVLLLHGWPDAPCGWNSIAPQLHHDGVYANPVEDVTRFEGTYTFRAVATYGETAKGRREAVWSIHVEPGIDPVTTTVVVVGGVLVVTPRDRYGSPLGPGRGDRITITAQPGTHFTGPVTDQGDGSYAVPVEWDPDVSGAPAVVVTQPGRDPIAVGAPPTSGRGCPRWLCWLLGVLVVVLLVLVVVLVLD